MKKSFSFAKDITGEFKKFALRGSVIDLAVGVIVGAAFNKIVNSLVSDIIMPPLGFILGRVDFSELYLTLSSSKFESLAKAREAGVPVIAYGLFINALIAFVITAFAIFIVVKFINKLKDKNEKEPEATPTTRACPFCFTSVSVKASRCSACTEKIEPLSM